jgi:hypothetical protein
LGVKNSTDAATRDQATQFVKAWFCSIGCYIAVYNDRNPLVAENGEAVVWISGGDTYMSCLNEELVRAGIVDIDDTYASDYTFLVDTKSSSVLEDWHERLRRAAESHKRGEKLRVMFQWPPK